MKKGLITGCMTLFLMMLFIQCVVEEPPYTSKVIYKNDTNTEVEFQAYFTQSMEGFTSPFKYKIPIGGQIENSIKVDPLSIDLDIRAPFKLSDSIIFIFHDTLKLKFTAYDQFSKLPNPTLLEYELENSGSGRNRVVTETFYITQEYLDSAKVIKK